MQYEIPQINTESDFAQELGIEVGTLRMFLYFRKFFYAEFEIPKRSGGVRIIRHPAVAIKGIQTWVLKSILEKVPPSSAATAYRVGQSLLENVEPHKGNRYFLLLDIEDFFGSISTRRVICLFQSLGFGKEAAKALGLICTVRESLPQGGVTSPYLSNLVCRKMDLDIMHICKNHHCKYTRYADDITISSRNRGVLLEIRGKIVQAIRRNGFQINRKKCHCSGPNQRVRVTGLVKNSVRSEFGIGRGRTREIKSNIFNLIVKKSYDNHFSLEQVLGYLWFLKSVDKKKFEDLKKFILRLGNRFPETREACRALLLRLQKKGNMELSISGNEGKD